ncbi:unnamed protein product, partial [Callosobruchus maculatus]
APPILRF